MKVEKYSKGWAVVWNDGSKSYYNSKKVAIKEMRKELGRNLGFGRRK